MKRVAASLLVCLTAGALLPRASAAALDNSDLARNALAVLEKNCAQCHGPNGKGEGHGVLDCILDVKKLIDSDEHYIVPGKPAESGIIKKVAGPQPKMPPKKDDAGNPVTQRPSAADVAILVQWIEAGAPDPSAPVAAREFISPAVMIDLMNADLNKLKRPIDRQHTRYFVLTHLYNAGVPDAQLNLYRAGLCKLVNSLSRKNPHIVMPKPIDGSHNTILRIDLREYSWNQRTWEDVLASYPYGVLPDTTPAQDVCTATDCKMPFMRADWFVYMCSKPPLYENILQIPPTVQELEKQLGIDSDDDVQRERVCRAAFTKSGVSNNNRLLERHEFANGAYYRSADFGSNVGVKNLFQHPLDYVADGGEIIFSLPNGLQAYLLVNGTGQRIEAGPIKIVHDDTQPDKTVVNGISCMSCHDRGMKDKDDEVRAHVLANPNAFTQEEQDKILALYPEREKFREFLEEDAARFKKACEKAGATFDKDEPVKVIASRFERELDMPLAASEMGMTVEGFKKVLIDNPELGKVFGLLNVNGGTVKREVFEDSFPNLVTAGGIGILQGALASGPADKLIQQAREALDKGDKVAALDLYGKAADKDPKSLAAHQGRGDLLYEDQKYADAVSAYSKAIDLDPNDTVSIGNRGLAHHYLGDKDLALADLNKAIDLQTLSAVVYATRGDIRKDDNDLAGAIADYTDANTKEPLNEDIAAKLAGAINDRGIGSLDLKNYIDAIADFQRAHDLAPKDVNIAYNLGLAHEDNGNHKEAVDDFQVVIDLDDKNVSAYQQKAIAEFNLDKFPDAIDDLKKAVDLQPDDALLHAQLGHCYLQNGNYDDAIDQTSTAIDKEDTAYARKVRGNAYAKRDAAGDADLAKADFDKADELEKDK